MILEDMYKVPFDKAYISVSIQCYFCAEFAGFVSYMINILFSTVNKF
jgi:hypothetical protein